MLVRPVGVHRPYFPRAGTVALKDQPFAIGKPRRQLVLPRFGMWRDHKRGSASRVYDADLRRTLCGVCRENRAVLKCDVLCIRRPARALSRTVRACESCDRVTIGAVSVYHPDLPGDVVAASD